MNAFTPSSTSAFIAGNAFYALIWSIAFELDTLLGVFGFKTKYRDRMFDWINKHKTLSLACTEAFNYALHGITNPLSVMFAMGGTVINALMIFMFLPLYLMFRRKRGYQTGPVVIRRVA